MSKLFPALFLACMTLAAHADDAVAPAASVPSPDKVLACNAEAVGGNAALAVIDDLRVELEIREPTFEVRGTYVASREGRMRIDIFAGDRRVFAEGLVGGRAWQWTPDGGVSDSRPGGAAALRNGIEGPGRFWTLEQLRQRGLGVELLHNGLLARDGEWQLRLTRADGSVFDYFLSRETCLPTRELSRRAFHPDVDPTEVTVETTYSEPFTVDGVVRFRRSEQRNLDTGEWLGTTVVRGVEHNVGLEAQIFDAESVAVSGE